MEEVIEVSKKDLEKAYAKWSKQYEENPESFILEDPTMQYDPKLQAECMWDYLKS